GIPGDLDEHVLCSTDLASSVTLNRHLLHILFTTLFQKSSSPMNDFKRLRPFRRIWCQSRDDQCDAGQGWSAYHTRRIWDWIWAGGDETVRKEHHFSSFKYGFRLRRDGRSEGYGRDNRKYLQWRFGRTLLRDERQGVRRRRPFGGSGALRPA